jgi:hypothetical protein
MISLNGVDFSQYGLFVKRDGYSGLFDLPALKKQGVDWTDQNYTEAPSRLIDMQYGNRLITLDCFITASSWTNLQQKLTGLRSVLTHSDLKLLQCPGVSNRGYVVFLQKTTIAKPFTYFRGNETVAEFKMVFEEPQPFNFQVRWDAREADKEVSIAIKKSPRIHTGESHKQSYINVWFNGTVTDHNIEKEDYVFAGTVSAKNYPMVITGNIDDITLVQLNEDASGLIEAQNFLRNGTIEVI